jgi:hypothetical protein
METISSGCLIGAILLAGRTRENFPAKCNYKRAGLSLADDPHLGRGVLDPLRQSRPQPAWRHDVDFDAKQRFRFDNDRAKVKQGHAGVRVHQNILIALSHISPAGGGAEQPRILGTMPANDGVDRIPMPQEGFRGSYDRSRADFAHELP